MTRRTRFALVSLVLVLVIGGSATSAVAHHRYRPPAEVHLSDEVRLGQFSEALVTLWARCRTGLDVQDLVVEVSQAGGTLFGSTSGDLGLVCDGAWHRLRVGVSTAGGGPFAPGWTTVTALLTVTDPATGDVVKQARDSITDWVRAQAEIKVSRDVRLGQGNAILVTLYARCERPWVPQPITVEVTQRDGTLAGSTSGDFGLVCDDRWHRIDVAVFSSGDRFDRGWTTVTAALDVLDPIQFDPVAQASDTETVWVKAPADVLIGGETEILADGTIVVPVFARCQEPWVVAGLVLDVTQAQNGGSNGGTFDLVCDGEWHRLDIPVAPVVGPWFPGPAVVNVVLDVEDPETFDPIYQATRTRTIELVGEPPAALYEQTGDQVGAIISADVFDSPSLQDTIAADDFVIPEGEEWIILAVDALGDSGTSPAVPSVNVTFYVDDGGQPGAALRTLQRIPVDGTDDLVIPLGLSVRLDPGTYWISVQADMSTIPDSSWLWSMRGTVVGDTGVFRTPDEDGVPWSVQRDYEFVLRGISGPDEPERP